MNLDELKEIVRAQMPEKRWMHTLGVVSEAGKLARRYDGDVGKAELSALLHDFCKAWPIPEQRRIMEQAGLPADLLDYDKELWHAHVGAHVVRERFGIVDEDVLDAIRYHTSGREKMTQLDKMVCLADYIEPGRDFPGVHKIRELAEHSLEEALIAGLDSTIRFLMDRRKKVYPLTLLARNGLIGELEGAENY